MAAASYVAFESAAGSRVTVNYDDVSLAITSFDLVAGTKGLTIVVTQIKNGRTQKVTLAPNAMQHINPTRPYSLAPDPDVPGALVQSDFTFDIQG